MRGVYDRAVTGRNDRASGILAVASPSGSHAPAFPVLAPESEQHASPGVNSLSDVRGGVRLTAAIFCRVEAASPWVIEIPGGATLARQVFPRSQHVISYHVVIGGACWGGVTGEVPVALAPGDVLVFPHGDPYVM